MIITYPVIFTDVENNILIEVPDLGILTQSNSEDEPKGSLADAIAMARDAIGIKCITLEDEGKEVKEPSAIESLDISKGTFADDGKGFISLVDVDLTAYRRKIDNRAVRRNVTLPNWLNVEADRAKINVSKVLQEALKQKIGYIN